MVADFQAKDLSIGKRIRAMRTELDLTYDEFAKQYGIPPRSLNNWELEKSEPSISSLRRLADATGVRLMWLIFGDGPMIAEDERGEPTLVEIWEHEEVLKENEVLNSALSDLTGQVGHLYEKLERLQVKYEKLREDYHQATRTIIALNEHLFGTESPEPESKKTTLRAKKKKTAK
jgi:transcriptional regulator with XRE-family HTH domain